MVVSLCLYFTLWCLDSDLVFKLSQVSFIHTVTMGRQLVYIQWFLCFTTLHFKTTLIIRPHILVPKYDFVYY